MKHKITIFLLFFVILTGCSKMHIEDTNGLEDYSLQEITEEDILTSTRVLYQMSIENSKIENGVQIVSKSANVFTGVDCLEKLTIKSPFTITITTSLEAGNFRVVIIKDGQIIDDGLINGTFTKTYTESGKYQLKIVGESAKFKISYSIEK